MYVLISSKDEIGFKSGFWFGPRIHFLEQQRVVVPLLQKLIVLTEVKEGAGHGHQRVVYVTHFICEVCGRTKGEGVPDMIRKRTFGSFVVATVLVVRDGKAHSSVDPLIEPRQPWIRETMDCSTVDDQGVEEGVV